MKNDQPNIRSFVSQQRILNNNKCLRVKRYLGHLNCNLKHKKSFESTHTVRTNAFTVQNVRVYFIYFNGIFFFIFYFLLLICMYVPFLVKHNNRQKEFLSSPLGNVYFVLFISVYRSVFFFFLFFDKIEQSIHTQVNQIKTDTCKCNSCSVSISYTIYIFFLSKVQ